MEEKKDKDLKIVFIVIGAMLVALVVVLFLVNFS